MSYDISCHPECWQSIDNLLNQKYTENSKHSIFINGQIFDIQRSTFCRYTFHTSTMIDLAFQPKRLPPTHWEKTKCPIHSDWSRNEWTYPPQMRSRWFTSESVDAQWVNMRGRSDKETWEANDKLEIWYRLLMIGSPPVNCVKTKLPRSSVPARHLNRQQKACLCFSLCL